MKRLIKRAVKLKLTYRVFKAYGMLFLRLATADEEYSVSVRKQDDTLRPTTHEFVLALHRLISEIRRGA